MDNIIEVTSLSKNYQTFERGHTFFEAIKSLFKRKYIIKEALKNANFSVRKGEIIGFIGPNGAGKSTTFKILTGVLYPKSGEVKVLNYVPYEQREEYVANIGVVFGQKTQLWWDLPAMDSFYLMRDIYEVPERVFERRLKKMVKLLGVQDIAKTPVRNMSLGERMKCELIASFLHNPKVVFLDEPTIGVDVTSKEKIREFILDMNRKFKTTVMLATHDVGDIEKLCKRVIVIDKGSIIYDGNLWELRRKYFNSKNIFVKFFEKKRKGPFKQRGVQVYERKGDYLRLRVDLSRVKIGDVVAKLMLHYDVADIDVNEPSIEDTIKKIYSEKK
jgi:ABC-2 type transport system ATP-binding protein